MVALVFGEGAGEDAATVGKVATTKPCDLTSALTRENAELDDSTEGVTELLRGVVDCGKLMVR